MVKVHINLKDEKNIDFAIYALVLSKKHEFSSNDLIEDIMSHQRVDKEFLATRIDFLLQKWVSTGLLQEHIDTFSVIK